MRRTTAAYMQTCLLEDSNQPSIHPVLKVYLYHLPRPILVSLAQIPGFGSQAEGVANRTLCRARQREGATLRDVPGQVPFSSEKKKKKKKGAPEVDTCWRGPCVLAGMPMPMRRSPARAAIPTLLLLLPMLLLPRAAGAAGDVRRALQFTGGCEPVVSLLGRRSRVPALRACIWRRPSGVRETPPWGRLAHLRGHADTGKGGSFAK